MHPGVVKDLAEAQPPRLQQVALQSTIIKAQVAPPILF